MLIIFPALCWMLTAVPVIYSQNCELYPVRPLGMTDKYNGIKDNQLMASSSFSHDTAARFARLHYSDAFYWDNSIEGAGAWVANVQNTQQWLQIDLGSRRVIQSIGTQGRQGSREWIMDYYVLYTDGDTPNQWAIYRDEYGHPFLFDGNVDDNGVKLNELKYPIVARYVRINPQRWHDLIALRVELFGCDYLPYLANFDGKTRIDFRLDRPGRATQTSKDTLRFRFKTNQIDGLILYGDDGQNDYFSVEIFRGRLRVSMNLGTLQNEPFKENNIIDAGSLLDDNQWHDVNIERNLKDVNISVDRIEMWRNLTATFMHMNMNRNLSLGGIPNFSGRRGISVTRNFVGCLEEFWFNGMNIIRDAQRSLMTPKQKEQDWQTILHYPEHNKQVWWGRQLTEAELDISGFVVHGSMGTECSNVADDDTVLTFPGSDAFLRISGEGGNSFQVFLMFRTFNRGGTLVYQTHNNNDNYIWLGLTNGEGHLQLLLKMDGIFDVSVTVENPDPTAQGKTFGDGLWHSVNLNILDNQIILTVDGANYDTYQTFVKPLNFDKLNYIGGGRPYANSDYIGCMRQIKINNKAVIFSKLNPTSRDPNIINGTCDLLDRCMPNPCKHQAPCTQSGRTFNCNCTLTGYTGQVCHQSEYPSSCAEVAMFRSSEESQVNVLIDMDGSGVLPPINVTCDFTDAGVVRTIVRHDAMQLTRVDGFDAPGSYRRSLDYRGATREALSELVRRAENCEQSITYKCWNARLLKRPDFGGTSYENRAWGWWVGRKGQPRYYWGGSVPGHHKCACGVRGQCEATCNCDGMGTKTPPLVDSGLLQYKDDLPVMEVRLGDTGGPYDNKFSEFQVGELRCEGDTSFDNIVTFRKPDASIELPALYSENEFDLSFHFRTTVTDAVFLQNSGRRSKHFLEIRIRQGNTLRFTFNVGNGVQIVEKTTAMWLNDNQWHTVRVERNRKEARLIVDKYQPVTYSEASDRSFQMFDFDQMLYVGSTQAYTDGYLGCIGNLIVNGVIQDLRGRVVRGEFTYGLSVGCKPKCAGSPCLNRGECHEYYSHYYCECGLTPYRGYVCGREVGAQFINGPILKIVFPPGNDILGSLDEYIQVGFKTKKKYGHLLQISGRGGHNYIIIKVNNNGGISLEFDVGFQRYEITTEYSIDLTNDQHHTVVMWRTKLGREFNLKVDDYPTRTEDYTSRLSKDSDTRIDDPAVLYIGRNESMPTAEGFVGCIYRAQYNNIFPLKMAFKDPKDPNVYSIPPLNIREDKCGYEEIMPQLEPIEIRPYPTIPPNLSITSPDVYFAQYQGAIAGGIVALILLVLLIILFIFCRHFSFERGDYETREAKGAEMVDNADMAIKYGPSGQPEVQGKEWWI